mgnify:CR=1 FL=1
MLRRGPHEFLLYVRAKHPHDVQPLAILRQAKVFRVQYAILNGIPAMERQKGISQEGNRRLVCDRHILDDEGYWSRLANRFDALQEHREARILGILLAADRGEGLAWWAAAVHIDAFR